MQRPQRILRCLVVIFLPLTGSQIAIAEDRDTPIPGIEVIEPGSESVEIPLDSEVLIPTVAPDDAQED